MRPARCARAGDRPDYGPCATIVPLATNRPALGFDILFEPTSPGKRSTGRWRLAEWRQKAAQARPGNGAAAHGRARTAAGAQRGESAGDRRCCWPSGFVVAVIKADEMVAIATRDHIPDGIALQLTDAGIPAGCGAVVQFGPFC